GFSGGDGI
nr:Chain C, GLY-PHE-SER-GLY-GLY-ASP-GLY-ILE [Planctopirus limnophila]5XOQ_D Chain D, GLY-PHE-SER-GLY-GLY-ASP-GLY-ILE [Planctopirus limnophila]